MNSVCPPSRLFSTPQKKSNGDRHLVCHWWVPSTCKCSDNLVAYVLADCICVQVNNYLKCLKVDENATCVQH